MSVFFMITVSFPEAMLASYFAIQFMGYRPRLPDVVIIGLIYAVVAYIVRSLPIPMGLHTILLIMSITVLIHLIARVSLWAASIGSIAGAFLSLLSDAAASQFVMFVTGQTMESLLDSHYKRMLVSIPALSIMFLIVLLFKRFNINFARITRWQVVSQKYQVDINSGDAGIYKQYLPAVVFLFLPVMLLWLVNFTQVSVQMNGDGDYHAISFKVLFNILVIILAFMSLWSVKRIMGSVEREMEAVRAAETIDRLKELILSIRKQRHDFNHQLQAVYGLMETGDFTGAREYIQNTYHYVSGTGELIKTDNPAVSALLYAKIGIAETRNIKFDINIECSLESFPLNANDASSLLGNLIDNAFDAVEGKGAGERLVRLDIIAERGEYILDVANRGEIDSGLSGKIFTLSFTTKEGHNGLGLAIVKDIAAKHRGSVRVSSGNGETLFRVIIPFKG